LIDIHGSANRFLEGRKESTPPNIFSLSPCLFAVPAAGGAAPEAKTEEAKEPEKTAFTVVLEKFDAAKKIGVIKEIRTITSLGLKEAKELVEGAPKSVKEGVNKEEAEKIIKALQAAGGTAKME